MSTIKFTTTGHSTSGFINANIVNPPYKNITDINTEYIVNFRTGVTSTGLLNIGPIIRQKQPMIIAIQSMVTNGANTAPGPINICAR